MKRRGFLGALAAVIAAPKALASLAKPDDVYHVRFTHSETVFAERVNVPARGVIRAEFPRAAWRLSDDSIMPSRPSFKMVER